jgi:hypothetical protein
VCVCVCAWQEHPLHAMVGVKTSQNERESLQVQKSTPYHNKTENATAASSFVAITLSPEIAGSCGGE